MSAVEEIGNVAIVDKLFKRFGQEAFVMQPTKDGVPTLWVDRQDILDVLAFLKPEYPLLYDLHGMDDRLRTHREDMPQADFSVVYQLLSFLHNADIRIKVALREDDLNIPTLTGIWPMANWYEREAWDMFGIVFTGHPNLRRILMPAYWEGHPLRKDHPCRATEMEPFSLDQERTAYEQDLLCFRPEEWGMKRATEDAEFMFLNLGPNHPSTHGPFRIFLQLDGEVVVDAVPDIGFHHRGAEKIGERQQWPSFMPYTDRIDYVAGMMNNLAYCLSVEKLAGIQVPDRAKVIRILCAELFRVISHLLFYGTYVQDVGQMSPVFYTFIDRERAFHIVEAFTGARMHPAWFRIGGVAADLPEGWDRMVREFVEWMPGRLDHYEKMCLKNTTVRSRTVGIGKYTTKEAVEWGVTGGGLRATGIEWDFRKARPYAGYDQFEFEIPTANNGDCFDRLLIRVEELRQSVRIIKQCLENMPEGPYKSDHKLTSPPPKERTMQDIETLIHHFTNVSWGPVVPPGEACVPIEGTKGLYGYHLVSDGGTSSYRTRIRTASFPHLQMIPLMSRGLMVPDLIAILASIDFVLADVDR